MNRIVEEFENERKTTTARHFGVVLLVIGACLLLACRTAQLLAGEPLNPTRLPATLEAGIEEPEPEAEPSTAPPTKTPDPNARFPFRPVGVPRCGPGDNSASIVKGRITSGGAPVVGMRITASSGPGGEPISEEPAESDEQGNYQVTFVCDGKACNGSFWVWLLDEEDAQASPFVRFVFDDRCRQGELNFEGR